MKKRKRADSVTGAVDAFNQDDIAPPVELTDAQMIYWQNAIRARAREAWTDIDLAHLVNFCKTMAYIDQTHKEIEQEGLTLINAKGTQIDNPAISRLEKLVRLSLAFSVKLHIHPEATAGESKLEKNKNANSRDARAKIEQSNDLIARPTQH